MFKVNNRNTRTRCETCSNLTIKTPERRLSLTCIFPYKDKIFRIFVYYDLKMADRRGIEVNVCGSKYLNVYRNNIKSCQNKEN